MPADQHRAAAMLECILPSPFPVCGRGGFAGGHGFEVKSASGACPPCAERSVFYSAVFLREHPLRAPGRAGPSGITFAHVPGVSGVAAALCGACSASTPATPEGVRKPGKGFQKRGRSGCLICPPRTSIYPYSAQRLSVGMTLPGLSVASGSKAALRANICAFSSGEN